MVKKKQQAKCMAVSFSVKIQSWALTKIDSKTVIWLVQMEQFLIISQLALSATAGNQNDDYVKFTTPEWTSLYKWWREEQLKQGEWGGER